MKNLRKLVPKEEIDALFKEIYDYPVVEKGQEKRESQVDKNYKIFIYKLKKIFRSSFLRYIPIDLSVEGYSVYKNTIPVDKPLLSVGFDIEEKYRFFISVDELFIKTIENVFQANNPFRNQEDNNNTQQYIENILEKTSLSIFENLPLKKNKIVLSKPVFYEEDFVCIKFDCKISNKEAYFYVSFDEILIDLMEIKPFIFYSPTTLGKKNINQLKKHTFVKVTLETKPVKISKKQLKENMEITLNEINIIKRYIT